jgi:hypothetical protein
MDAPVVENPDTVSNKASTKLGISPEITKGRLPTILNTTQLRVTQTKPSFAPNILGAPLHRRNRTLSNTREISIVTRNPLKEFPSPENKLINRGGNMNIVSIAIVRAIKRPIIL